MRCAANVGRTRFRALACPESKHVRCTGKPAASLCHALPAYCGTGPPWFGDAVLGHRGAMTSAHGAPDAPGTKARQILGRAEDCRVGACGAITALAPAGARARSAPLPQHEETATAWNMPASPWGAVWSIIASSMCGRALGFIMFLAPHSPFGVGVCAAAAGEAPPTRALTTTADATSPMRRRMSVPPARPAPSGLRRPPYFSPVAARCRRQSLGRVSVTRTPLIRGYDLTLLHGPRVGTDQRESFHR